MTTKKIKYPKKSVYTAFGLHFALNHLTDSELSV